MAAEVHTSAGVLGRSGDFGALYEENYRLLVGTAIKNYHISQIDAQTLAHEVFLAYFLKASEVINPRAWLVSAVCNAAKAYLRTRARLVELPPAYAETPDPSLWRIGDALPDQLACKEAFGCLTARCQIALRLRYLEGYSVREVAIELNTSLKYAEKLVRRCLRQAKDRYTDEG
jgi:RNA polymerase sigma factor (sigma-70 family)